MSGSGIWDLSRFLDIAAGYFSNLRAMYEHRHTDIHTNIQIHTHMHNSILAVSHYMAVVCCANVKQRCDSVSVTGLVFIRVKQIKCGFYNGYESMRFLNLCDPF